MMEYIFIILIMIILLLFIIFVSLYSMYKLKKKAKIIVFNEVSIEDLELYNKLKRYFWKMQKIIFLVFLPLLILLIMDYYIKKVYILIPIVILMFILIMFLKFFLLFYGAPVGVKEGRVSRKWIKYPKCGYKYNIYFEDINKSIVDLNLQVYKGYPTIQRNDKVKVYKTRLGFIYIIPYK